MSQINNNDHTQQYIAEAAKRLSSLPEHELKQIEIRLDDLLRSFGTLMIYRPFQQSGLEPLLNFQDTLHYWERTALMEQILEMVRTIRIMAR
jgi:hypothetical protein